jgi:WD40 repeat protein
MPGKPKYDAFICHSTKDNQFVAKLERALQKEGRTTWIDRAEVQPSEQWITAIHSGIEASHNFLFVISPDALASPDCRDELQHAAKHNKRLIPVLAREVAKGTLPDELAQHNWVDFRNGNDFKKAARSLLTALDVDLNHVREHTRILTRAIDWDTRDKNRSLMLRGRDLIDSENWLSNSDSKLPEPTALQTQFVLASRKDQTQRQRLLLLISVLGLIVAASLAALFFYQKNLAVKQEHTANARRLLAQAEVLANQGKGALALSLTIESMRRLPSLEADQLLRKQLKDLSEPVAQLNFDAPAESITCSPSGKYYAVARGKRWKNTPAGNAVWLLDASTGKKIREFKHDDNTNTATFDRSEKHLATASDDGTVRIWDLLSGMETVRFKQDGGVMSLAFSADGKYLAGSGRKWFDADIRPANERVHPISKPEVFVWEVSTGREVGCPVRCDHAESVRFDNENGFLVYSDDFNERAVRWDVETGKTVVKSGWGQGQSSMSLNGRYIAKDVSTNIPVEPIDEQDYTYEIRDVFTERTTATISYRGARPEITLSPDGKYLAIADLSVTSVWNVTSPREVLRLTGRQSGNPTAFGSGELIAVRTSDGASVWDLDTQEEVARVPSDKYLSAVSFNRDGTGLITGDDRGVIELWKMPNGKESFELLTKDRADDVWFDPDGKTIRALSLDGTLAAWDLETHSQISSSQVFTKVSDTQFSSDRKYLAVNENNSVVHILDSSAREINRVKLAEQPTGTYFYVRAVSPTGIYIVGETSHPPISEPIVSRLEVFDTTTGRRITTVTYEGQLWVVTFSADGKRFATGGRDGSARVWSTSDGVLLNRLETGSPVHLLSFTPDDKFLVAGGEASNIRLWDTSTWQEQSWLKQSGPVWTISSSNDGAYLALGGKDGIARIWDVPHQRQVLELKHEGDVHFLVFSGDNRFLLTTRGYGTARVWEVNSGREISRFDRENPFQNVDISPNGRYLATSCCNQILVESLWPADLISAACSRLTRNLTAEEWRDYVGTERYEKTCPGRN